jgi:hypothetical protein
MRALPRILGILVVAFLGGKLAVLTANLRWFPTLVDAGSRQPRDGKDSLALEPITMLVPARNEAARLPGSLPGLLAAGASTVIFLDDESTDGTRQRIEAGSVALSAMGPDLPAPEVRIVRGTARPDGWVGKTWPCEQLAALTDTDLLVFCDADVELAPGALPVVIAEMRRQRAEVFSVICRQRAVSWSERLLTPLITDVILCLFPFGLLRAPAPSAATAEGMLLIFQRSAYQRLGGFAAVRDEIVEDVAIARLARRRGLRLGLVLGGDLVQCRMYTGYREVIDGMGRGLAPVVGGRRWVVAAGWVLHLAAYTAPVLLLGRSPLWRWALLMGLSERLLVEAKTGGRDWKAALAVSLSPIAALPVVARAMRRTHSWKGRQYG